MQTGVPSNAEVARRRCREQFHQLGRGLSGRPDERRREDSSDVAVLLKGVRLKVGYAG